MFGFFFWLVGLEIGRNSKVFQFPGVFFDNFFGWVVEESSGRERLFLKV